MNLDSSGCEDSPPGYEPGEGYIPWAHNLYIEILAERGLVGMAAFAVLLAAVVRHLARGIAEGGRTARHAAAWTAMLVMASST